MLKKPQVDEVIRERLEELFKLGASLQDYVHAARTSAPADDRVRDLIDELLRLEVKLSIINEILYQEKNSLAIQRAIERIRRY